MEKIENDNNKYQKTKIYRVIDNTGAEQYIGSTVKPLSARMASHRAGYRKFKASKSSSFITVFTLFDKYGVENTHIELIELYPCNSSDEKRQREGFHIRANECVNKRIECRTDKEYYNDNRDKLLSFQKEYRENNTDKIRLYKKEYQIRNKVLLSEKKKKYKEEHPERIAELNRISAIKQRQKIQCPQCDLCVCRDTLGKHIKACHTEKQLIECPHCDKRVLPENLSNHMKTMYCTSYNPNINHQELKKTYMIEYRRTRAEQIREKRREYNSALVPCQVCGKEYSGSNLTAHTRPIHPEKLDNLVK